VGAELFHADERTDTDGHDEAKEAFRNFVKAPKTIKTQREF